MNEYNERLLKNVLQDCREETDEQLLKEIEEAKNNPLFQNKEGEAESFALKHTKKSKKKFGNNENDNLLLSYDGEFVPTFIPDGYSVESINNGLNIKEIVFSNSNNIIVFREQVVDFKQNVDYADADNLQNIEILGYNGISFTKDGINRIVLTTEEANIYISCDDDTVDLIGFAEKIEKR